MLSASDIADVIRFAGYPIAAAAVYQGADVQGNLASLNAVIGAMSPVDEANVQALLANLRLLDADLPAMRAAVVVAKAGSFMRNMNELADRQAMFFNLRRELCSLLGIAPGPGIFAQGPASAILPSPLTV